MMKKINIAIHKDRVGSQSYGEKWADYLNKKSINFEFVDLYAYKNSLQELKKYDAVFWRYGLNLPESLYAPKLLDVIENQLKIPVYPNAVLRYAWEDKLKQALMFNALDINSPKSYVFYNRKEANNWAKDYVFPIVFKLNKGAGSSNVTLVNNVKEAKRVIDKSFTTGIDTTFDSLKGIKNGNLFYKTWYKTKLWLNSNYNSKCLQNSNEKNYVLFQEFLRDNKHDTRVTIIDNKAFAFRRFNRENDFRASGSGNIDYNIDNVDIGIVKRAFEINAKLGFNSMAYDFVYDNNGDISLLEACWTFMDKAIHNSPGYFDENLNFVKGNFWPEELQIDFFVRELLK